MGFRHSDRCVQDAIVVWLFFAKANKQKPIRDPIVKKVGEERMTIDFISLTIIVAIAAIAPIITRLIPKQLIPEIVILLFAGAFLGPHMAGFIQVDDAIKLISDLGLAFLFLFAGFEISPTNLTNKQGRRGFLTWVISFGIAYGVMVVLSLITKSSFDIFATTIALVTTALGTILPILQERHLMGTPVGDAVLSYGTWGELCPVIAMALLLTTRATWLTIIILFAFVLIAVIVALLGSRLRSAGGKLYDWFTESAQTTSQSFVRLTVLLLVLLTAVSAVFDLDIVLGAFAAGFVLRAILPEGNDILEEKLQGIGYGFFIPVFFVVSGTSIDIAAVFTEPMILLGFIVLLLFMRGLPVFVALSIPRTQQTLSLNGRLSVSLYCTTALPLIVAVTSVAVGAGTMSQETASVLIFAGAITVLIMPLLASITYRVADLHPLVATKEIIRNPHNYLHTINDHRQMGKMIDEARHMDAEEIMTKTSRMAAVRENAIERLEHALSHESPETIRRYMDEMYRELSETLPDTYHKALAQEMTSWYTEAQDRYDKQKTL